MAQTSIHTPLPQVSTLGGEIPLIDPGPEHIELAHAVKALSRIARFNGHTTRHVSILHHSVVAFMLAKRDNLQACSLRAILWHDLSEAYVGDMTRPMKHHLGDAFAKIEAGFTRAISLKLGIDFDREHATIKHYDNMALAIECRRARPPASYAEWEGLSGPFPGEARLFEDAGHIATEVFHLGYAGSEVEAIEEWLR